MSLTLFRCNPKVAAISASFAMFTALVSTAAAADTFAASIVLPQGHQVLPGEPLPIQVLGLLSNAAPGNGGLAYFRMDFAMSGPETITLGDALVLGPPPGVGRAGMKGMLRWR